jgi:hypothetical protein
MNNSNEPTNGTVAANGLDYAQEAFQRVLEQLRDQQGLIERLQQEVEQLRQEKSDLYAELDRALAHFGVGPETWPNLSAEQIKEMDESGLNFEQVIAEMNAGAGR